MACVAAVVWKQGSGYGTSLIRVAMMHGSSPCNEKWDNKWKSMAYGYMDAETCRKRHRNYVKQQKRAANKRALRKWRSFEMNADEYYREVQEKAQETKQQVHASTSRPHTTTASSWSHRLEEKWRAFQKTYKGKQWGKYQTSTKKPNHEEEDPTYGTRGNPDSNFYGESESAKYRRQFWSNTWNSNTYWNFRANASGRSSRPNSQGSRVHDMNIGSPADRIALGLSPAGPLSLNDVKLAFRQCALTWHPDRHHGDQKQFAEAKFKRVGDAYRTLRGLL